jgi:hypothetical protein
MVSDESSMESWEINLCRKLAIETSESYLSFTSSDDAESMINDDDNDDDEMATKSDEKSSFCDEELNEYEEKSDVLEEEVKEIERNFVFEESLCEWDCSNSREDFDFYY